MNGEPLPVEHGFPVRMVVPGLYGYVSATKWVVDLEVTRFDRAEAYWTPRGWSARGPIKTASRIDVPTENQQVEAGRVAIAGVAWAQHRGIRAVEVQLDDGAVAAREARRRTPRPTPGGSGSSRGTRRPGSTGSGCAPSTATGAVQTGEAAPPAPDGATGWHTIDVQVS